jgi:hypothetical protein
VTTSTALHLKAIVYGLAVLAVPTELHPFAAVAYLGWLAWAWDDDHDRPAPSIESIPARPGHP